MKKNLALLLSIVMLFSLAPPVFANGTEPAPLGYEYEWVQIWISGAYDYERDYNKYATMRRENASNTNRLWARANPSNSFGPPSASDHLTSNDDDFTGIGLFVDGVTFKFGYGLDDYRKIYRQPNRNIPDIVVTEVTWTRNWHDEAVRAYLMNVELVDGTTVERYYIGELYNNAYYFRNGSSGYPEPGFVFGHSVEGVFINTYIWLPDHIFRADALRLVDITDSLFNGNTNRCPVRNPGRTFRRYDDGYDVDAISVWYKRRIPPEYEWVQIWIAGAYDYERDYDKYELMRRINPSQADRLWSRSNPSNSFGPPSAPNHINEGDSEFTGIGLFVDGITFKFGYGLDDYRRIYRQPNRNIPDIVVTEVTWSRNWHDEAVRAYLMNVELVDGTIIERYYIGELYNNAYYFRSGSSGYPEPGFVFGHSIDGNFINTYIWLPEHIRRADSLRLVDITDSFFNGSTDRCPVRNPGRTFRRYDDGYDVDAISVWYRRRIVRD